ncbi:thermonuclease family protein [Myxococcota bacterium]|nr:thermonuclease family protein [Myxococcota bacterium]
MKILKTFFLFSFLMLGACSMSGANSDSKVVALATFDKEGTIIGEFKLPADAIIDGDTIKVVGLDSSLRLLGIDTEETFKKKHEKELFAQGWDYYLKTMQGDSGKPVKMATPLGEDAKDYAKEFFKGVETVRLERNHPKAIRGYYGRILAYVFAKKDGKWVNYQVECVRAGMSPYFMKYGYSLRFHDEFVAAQKEARAAKVGIWEPGKMHYQDYDKRLEWWERRAQFIEWFSTKAAGKPNHIVLTHWDSLFEMERNLDKEVYLLGTVGKVRPTTATGPTLVMLSRRRNKDIPLVFFDKAVLANSGILDRSREFVRVRGKVNKYKSKSSGRESLQIIINSPDQIETEPR